MAKSLIEWCTATWPIVDGCTEATAEIDGKVVMDEACRHCWARTEMGNRHAHLPRFAGLTSRPVLDGGKLGPPKWTGEVRFQRDLLDVPLRRKKPERYFVASRGDLFNDRVDDEEIASVHAVEALADWHTYLHLTKRTERAREWSEWYADALAREAAIVVEMLALQRAVDHSEVERRASRWPRPNVWFGFTAASQPWFDLRWADAKHVPAAVHYVSLEPLLERVVLPPDFLELGARAWVIVGCESGARRRPFDEQLVRLVRDQAHEAGVNFFYKQGQTPDEKRRVVSLPILDGWRWAEMPGVATR